MKLLILPATLAALALSQGCRDPHPTRPPEARPSLVSAARASPPPDAGVVAEADVTTTDAAEPEFDPIALEHSHRDGTDHLRRSHSMRDEGDLLGALAEARRAVADDPKDDLAVLQVARLATVIEDAELAAEAWGRFAQLDPDDSDAAVQHARSLLALKEYDYAVMSGLDAIERDPANPEAFHVTARAYLSKGALDDAITYFQKTLELMPDHGYALNNLGFAFLRANRNEEAVEVLKVAVELLPTVAYVHNNLGVALERVGDLDAARAEYGLASSLSPKYVKAAVNQARMRKVAAATPHAEEPAAEPEDDLAAPLE